MKSVCKLIVLASIISVLAPAAVWAVDSIPLNAITFPERKNIKFDFQGTSRAPRAEVEGKVEFQDGQADIEIEFDNMKPAVLFGGDITCYVVWAVSRDGTFDNLGELWMPENKGRIEFTSGRKAFALLITAEPFARVSRPSELVMLSNLAAEPKKAPTDIFDFSGLGDAADHQLDSITNIAWDSNTPLDLRQAEKVYELALRHDAKSYTPDMIRGALITLGQARNMASKDKQRADYRRQSIALSGDAIEITLRRKEAEELERQIALRRAEMEALESRAQEAEERSASAIQGLETAQLALKEASLRQAAAEASIQQSQLDMNRMATEKIALETEQAAILASLEAMREESENLRIEGEQLRKESERLQEESRVLSGRLEGALSQVAETRDSARGTILNLPDILFDLNKAALKSETQIIIAKLSGILLIMPDLNVRVEGHTDSTGGDDYNLRLSEQRAQSVSDFLRNQGIDPGRLQSVGYGKTRPVADNESAEGRKKNRRVEIVIARGEIGE
ncbi:MAG: OmpA family protein [Acidobacteriota bacterium]